MRWRLVVAGPAYIDLERAGLPLRDARGPVVSIAAVGGGDVFAVEPDAENPWPSSAEVVVAGFGRGETRPRSESTSGLTLAASAGRQRLGSVRCSVRCGGNGAVPGGPLMLLMSMLE